MMDTIRHPPPQALDMVRAARLVGWGAVTGRDGGLTALLAAADPRDVRSWLSGLIAADPVLMAGVASGRWRATGRADDLKAAIAAAWDAFPAMAGGISIPTPAGAPDLRRRRLAAAAIRAIRSGSGPDGLAAALRAVAPDASDTELASAGRWAIRAARKEPHNATA